MRREREALTGIVLAAGTLLVSTSLALAAAAAWKIEPTPNPSGDASGFAAVSCPSVSACTAVGSSAGGPGGTTIGVIEHAVDAFWSIQPAPNPGSEDRFIGVSCPVPTGCLAVGSYESGATTIALAESWNGKGWVLLPVPSPPPALSTSFASVSCTSMTSCTAVGTYETDSDAFTLLVERWNGVTWAVQPAPGPAGAMSSGLTAVSCVSSAMCLAAGNDTNSSGVTVPLATEWNGKTWATQTIPTPPGGGSALTALACTSTIACNAVGWETPGAPDRPVVIGATWNGAAWTLRTMPSPKGATSSVPHGVACVTATNCIAVGSYVKGSISHTFAVGWNGSVWTDQTTPAPSGASVSELLGVTCPASSFCIAAGDAQFPTKPEQTLIEHRS